MKKIVTEIVVVLVLLTVIVLLGNTLLTMRKEINRMSDNLTNQVKVMNDSNAYFRYSMKEFRQTTDIKIDSILQASKIRPKMVQEITHVHNYYYDIDTTIIKPEPTITARDTIYSFTDLKDCFYVAGFMKIIQDRPELTITERKYINDTDIIVYQERKHKFLGIFWGRKQTFLETPTDCGKTTVKKVDIIKKH